VTYTSSKICYRRERNTS